MKNCRHSAHAEDFEEWSGDALPQLLLGVADAVRISRVYLTRVVARLFKFM